MFNTIAKSAAVGTALAFIRKHGPGAKSHSSYLSSLGLVALGVVVGASAGLLLAPKSGSELRADMKTKAKQLQAKASEKVATIRSSSNGRGVETNV